MTKKYKSVTTVGPVSWAKLTEGNRDMDGYNGSYVECEGAYTLDQEMSKEEFEKLAEAGSMKGPKRKYLMEGKIVVGFARKHKVMFNGEVLEAASGPPVLQDSEGNPWTGGDIGNGSVCEVTNLLSFFTAPNGDPSCRTTLIEVKVLEHVVYDRDAEAA